jgi:exosortase B
LRESFGNLSVSRNPVSNISKPNLAAGSLEEWFKWLPVGLGLVVMYTLSYLDVARVFWSSEVGAHGPIILAVVVWLIWRRRDALVDNTDVPRPKLGWSLVALGLLLFILGRSQGFFAFEIGSQIPLLLGILLALRGPQAVRALWFAILFIAFLVPIPNSLLDAILIPLKESVSIVVERLLYAVGYPVARSGVVLTIGQYQLLIANACSGLNSMIALSGVGLLFAYMINSSSRLHTGLLLASILPIAFLANIVRVLIMMLVTYHFGDAAGHAFHDYAGYLEIAFAFGAFFALERLIDRFVVHGEVSPANRRGATA